MAHEKDHPGTRLVTTPVLGAVIGLWPTTPQHTGVPSDSSAHAWRSPRGGSTRTRMPAENDPPEQTTVPSEATAQMGKPSGLLDMDTNRLLLDSNWMMVV